MLFSKKIKRVKNYLRYSFNPHLQQNTLFTYDSLIIFYKAEKIHYFTECFMTRMTRLIARQ